MIRLRACSETEFGDTTLLEFRTLNAGLFGMLIAFSRITDSSIFSDLNNWTLSMSSTYANLNAENTRESLLDGNFTTGAAAYNRHGNKWIQATFPYSVPVKSVTIAPLHKNPKIWAPRNGNGGSLQYSHDNQNWTTVATITYVERRKQQFNIKSVTAQYWRLFCSNALGTSSFMFK